MTSHGDYNQQCEVSQRTGEIHPKITQELSVEGEHDEQQLASEVPHFETPVFRGKSTGFSYSFFSRPIQ